MSDPANNSKSSIADKIHQAVSSLLETETRLNFELNEARTRNSELVRELEHLHSQLVIEREARSVLEQKISDIGKVILA